MSGGWMCQCPAYHNAGSAAAKKKYGQQHWRVTQYKCNHSAFNGYRKTPSQYSEVQCNVCGHRWRTTGAYVETLSQATNEELGILSGCGDGDEEEKAVTEVQPSAS